jgi:hypothetical protein
VTDRITGLIQQAQALHHRGQLARAQALYEEILQTDPDHFDVLHDLGIIALQSQNPRRAVDFINQAISLNPHNAAMYSNRGVALRDLKQLEASIASCDQAIAIKPDFTEARFNRSLALHDLNQLEAAIESYDQIVANKPDFAEAWFHRGLALYDLKRLDAAIISYDRAIALKPDFAEAWSNRGIALFGLNKLDAAIISYDRAIELKPDFAEAWSNRGNALFGLKKLDAAIVSYDRAIELRPDYAEAFWNKSLALLLIGDYSDGWKLYEWRWKADGFPSPKRSFTQKLWIGDESIAGKTILLHSEQGLGDTIQFCRYVKLVADLGARVIFEIDQPLIGLLMQLEGVASFVTKGTRLPLFDCHCPLMSLALAFNTTIETIPSASKYLSSDKKKLTHWAGRLGKKVKPRIGLVWSGARKHLNDHNRSILLSSLINKLPSEFQYVSLQKEVSEDDRKSIRSQDIVHFGDEMVDFTDTAALCDLMDLVISVDTSVGHLSAALGKPTWLLLPFSPDWRWLLDREDSLWYPSIKLYRQESIDDWTNVFESIKADLLKFTTNLNRNVISEPAIELTEELFLRALAFHQRGELAQAQGLYAEILESRSSHVDALHHLGIIASQMQDHQRAADLINQAITLNPHNAAFYSNRGVALRELKQYEAAIASYDQAIALIPDYVEAWYNRGLALHALKQYEAAIASYDRAIVLKPDYAEANNNRGLSLYELKQFEAAIAGYEQAIKLKPDYVEAWYNRGLALQELRQSEAAIASYDQAIKIRPDFYLAWSNRGNVLKELKQHEAALASHNRAIAIKPDYAEAYSNRGNVLQELGQLESAVASYDQALAIKPDLSATNWNKSIALLSGGDYDKGWKLYEWRWKTTEIHSPIRNFSQQLWLGYDSLEGKTILLHSEQGLGDTIQFCRYVKLVVDLGARVIFEVEEALIGLLRQLDGVAEFVVKGAELPAFDLHCPLMSLPLAFNTTLANIPSAFKYLSSDINKSTGWALRLGSKTKPRIGLAWSGSQQNTRLSYRRLPLYVLLEQLPPEFQYVSLQKEVWDADKLMLESANIAHFGDELKDFTDTAALCDLMDLVISIDTGVAHLSAALGKPTWLLLPFSSDWRWLLDRDDSPWYPSVKLYRQEAIGEWETVFERVRDDLSKITM